MLPDTPPHNEDNTPAKRFVGALMNSPVVNGLLRIPPVAWLVRSGARLMVRRQLRQMAAVQDTPVEQMAARDLQSTLDAIVRDVVHSFGYSSAMVATYEQGDALVVRALYVDPSIASMEKIREWEALVARVTPYPISITDPKLARVYRYQDRYSDNLSIRAAEAGRPVVSTELFDLFTPIAPPVSREIVRGIQAELRIQQVIAAPFFVSVGDNLEMVGNLFAAKQDVITEQDQRVLAAFGRQAAAAIESERRRLQNQLAQELVYEIQSNLDDEHEILQHIVEGVVRHLGYAGAMVAPYEADGALPVRALWVDPAVASMEQIREWEQQASRLSPYPLSITDPDIARVYVNDDRYSDNLSVRAAKAGEPVVSDELFDLFTPVVPDTRATREFVRGIQEALEIRQVIAVPFFLRAWDNDTGARELVGNLFATARSKAFSAGEIEILAMFGQQAAAGIRNARLYRISNERREVAQVFGKMAFSASAYVHELRNHIGFAKSNLQMLGMLAQLPPDLQEELLATTPRIIERLNQTAEILDNLHEPWRQQQDALVDVNRCLIRAIDKVSREGLDIAFEQELDADLPGIYTSHDMLTEAFRVIIKNAMEAVRVAHPNGRGMVQVATQADPQAGIVRVMVRDNGVGIRQENLGKIFEMRWSTKEFGLGFGLFWAKDYISGLNGHIEVESEWGSGTTFWLTIPTRTVPQTR
jgi:signal transduction histidine kinase